MDVPSLDQASRGASAAAPSFLDSAALSQAIGRSRDYLRSLQHENGHWCGELEGDTILESEYILLLAWAQQERSPLSLRCAQYLLDQQLPTGGWAMYSGGTLEISGSVKAYFALKLTGHDPESEPLVRARTAIMNAGGADRVNTFTRFYLALLGQISYDLCPAVPPEMMLLPSWSPINIYRISAWSRTMFVPLSIVWAHRPTRAIEPNLGIQELFIQPSEAWPQPRCPGLEDDAVGRRWEAFFRAADSVLKRLDRCGIKPLRKLALRRAEKWMTERFVGSDGLGAIFPPIIWSAIALKCLGYDDAAPEVQYNFEQLKDLVIDDGRAARLQPCKSPVWDTAIALRALAAAGDRVDEPRIAAGIDWLLAKEVSQPGDCLRTVGGESAGWYFEYHNEFYPDVDDTIMVMMALREASGADVRPGQGVVATRLRGLEQAKRHTVRLTNMLEAAERGYAWIKRMQNRDGGWGAFDRDNDAKWLCRVPFADHNAMIDPSTPDITGRVLEAMAPWGAKRGEAWVERAIAFCRRTQESDGAWYGRWGVNYIYGTWQTLVGLRAIGLPKDDPTIRRGAQWLKACQQADGGWGESADSYLQPELRGRGPTTASQTAWALLGLLSCDEKDSSAVTRGVQWLLDRQRGDGGWDEPQFTGTGFPLVFYLKYHYYPLYFPLLALATYDRRGT